MSVLALITKASEIELVIPWAAEFASGRNTNLVILLWTHSPTIQPPLRDDGKPDQVPDRLAATLTEHLAAIQGGDPEESLPLDREAIQVRSTFQPDVVAAAMKQVQTDQVELLVAAAEDPTGQEGATYSNNPLLRNAPCNTIILFPRGVPALHRKRIMFLSTDNPHDTAAFALGGHMSLNTPCHVTLARIEDAAGDESLDLGRRELRQIMRDASVQPNSHLKRKTLLSNQTRELSNLSEKHDLLILGLGHQQRVADLIARTARPVIGVFKRAAPIRPWSPRDHKTEWIPRLSAPDFADLIQTLRHGSRLNADFVTMLGLASAIASLGLLQDSPAVVIGSMLLAPLMTPMITAGLAIAQANERLGRSAIATVTCGGLLTLAVSFLIGWITPGEEMTQQIIARGDPDLLDLLVAFCSASAAAYAMARPSIVGAMAGVAIATALVPPLCSAGISAAYYEYGYAQGAFLLFITNLVAIVLSAAITFRLLGIRPNVANLKQRRWVIRVLVVFGSAIVALALPLEQALQRHIDRGKPQPRSYPLTSAVQNALEAHLRKTPDVDLVASGIPSSLDAEADVVIFLTTPKPLSESYADELTKIVRMEFGDPSLVVKVHCLQEAWKR